MGMGSKGGNGHPFAKYHGHPDAARNFQNLWARCLRSVTAPASVGARSLNFQVFFLVFCC